MKTISKKSGKAGRKVQMAFAALVIPLALAISIIVFKYVLGDPANFQGSNPENNPIAGNYFGMVYKGGFIVPILMTLLLTVITFTLERLITIRKARGKNTPEEFVYEIRELIKDNKLDAALVACEKQKGSIANVIQAGLTKYLRIHKLGIQDIDKATSSVKKEIEEATSLELPMLSKNLTVLSTIASFATLMGLLGTVMGMIRSFAALAHAGAPDAVALATGISEALINTAFGIGTSAIAIIFYNFFNNKIDAITYGIEEAGFSVVESISAHQ